ncbi:MAG: hypothetical protein ACUVUC_04055 [Thermoguttaceae bacterium]
MVSRCRGIVVKDDSFEHERGRVGVHPQSAVQAGGRKGHEEFLPRPAELLQLPFLVLAEVPLALGVGVHPGDQALQALRIEADAFVAAGLSQ